MTLYERNEVYPRNHFKDLEGFTTAEGSIQFMIRDKRGLADYAIITKPVLPYNTLRIENIYDFNKMKSPERVVVEGCN